jgi:hypothetical protein
VEATLYQTRGGALSAREVALLPSVVIGLPLCREARDDGRTAVVPPGDFETAIARDKSGAPRCATGLTSPRRRKFASPHRSCRSGRGGPRASTHCCRFSTCAGCRPATSKRRSPRCWARTLRTYHRRRGWYRGHSNNLHETRFRKYAPRLQTDCRLSNLFNWSTREPPPRPANQVRKSAGFGSPPVQESGQPGDSTLARRRGCRASA